MSSERDVFLEQAARAVHAMWHDGRSREEALQEAARRYEFHARGVRWLARWSAKPIVKGSWRSWPHSHCSQCAPEV